MIAVAMLGTALITLAAIDIGPVDEGPYAFVRRDQEGKSWQFADVIARCGDGEPLTIRFEHARTHKRLGEHRGALYMGERGDDGLFVFHDLPVGAATTKTRYVDKRGKVVLTVERECTSFFDGRAACVWQGSERRYGYIDKQGAVAIAPTFVSLGRFRDGIALVQTQRASDAGPELDAFTFIGLTGTPRFRPSYRVASAFSQQRAFVVSDDEPSQRGYIDDSGAIIVSLPDESGDPFSDGVAVVRGPGGERVIDGSGRLVMRIPLPFRVFDKFENGRARLSVHGSVGAVLALDGTISEVSELWRPPPPWPAALGAAPSALMRPKGNDYGSLATAAARAQDDGACARAAGEMVALSRGGDPDAWLAVEECARRAHDVDRVGAAHAAWLHVMALDPSTRQAREAWARSGGRIAVPAR